MCVSARSATTARLFLSGLRRAARRWEAAQLGHVRGSFRSRCYRCRLPADGSRVRCKVCQRSFRVKRAIRESMSSRPAQDPVVRLLVRRGIDGCARSFPLTQGPATNPDGRGPAVEKYSVVGCPGTRRQGRGLTARATGSPAERFPNGPHRFHDRRDRRDRALRKGHAGQCLRDLHRPSPAGLSIDAIPVVEAERHIAVLLNFENYNIPQGVYGSGS